MADNTITLTLGVDDKGTAILRSFQKTTEQTFQKIKGDSESLVDSVKKHWLGLTAAATAAGLAIHRAWALADAAAQYQEQKASLNALASQYGTTAGQIISSIQDVSKGLVSMSDAVGIAGSAMAKGLSPEQIINLASAAETLSNVTGQKVSDSFRSMAESIALGRSRGIEAAVGMIDLKDKYGDLVEKMSEAEKAQKMYAIVMERIGTLQKTLGEGTDSTADKMERLTVQIADLRLAAGAFVIKGGLALYGILQGTASAALFLASGIFGIIAALGALSDKLGLTSGAFAKWRGEADAALAAAEDLAKKGSGNLAALFASNEDIAGAAGGKKGFVGGMGSGAPAPGAAVKETSLKEVTEETIEYRSRARNWLEEFGQKDTQKEEAALYIEDVRLREQTVTQIMQEANASRTALMEHEAWVAEKTAAQMLIAAKTHEWAEQSRSRIVSTAYKAMENQMLRFIETGKFSVGAMAKVIAAQVKMELVGIAARAAVHAVFYTGLGLAAAASGNAASASLYFAAAGQMGTVAAVALTAAAGVQAMTGGSTGQTSGGSMAAIGGGGTREDNQYRYYGYESSQYGSGWRPGEGQGPGKTGDTYIFNGDVYDKEAFDKRVNSSVQQNIKDNGKTRDVIRRYS